jgi:hypothetical protein
VLRSHQCCASGSDMTVPAHCYEASAACGGSIAGLMMSHALARRMQARPMCRRRRERNPARLPPEALARRARRRQAHGRQPARSTVPAAAAQLQLWTSLCR